MREAIVVILWISGIGVNLGEADTWQECETVISALEQIDLDTSCHLIQKSMRPKRRLW